MATQDDTWGLPAEEVKAREIFKAARDAEARGSQCKSDPEVGELIGSLAESWAMHDESPEDFLYTEWERLEFTPCGFDLMRMTLHEVGLVRTKYHMLSRVIGEIKPGDEVYSNKVYRKEHGVLEYGTSLRRVLLRLITSRDVDLDPTVNVPSIYPRRVLSARHGDMDKALIKIILSDIECKHRLSQFDLFEVLREIIFRGVPFGGCRSRECSLRDFVFDLLGILGYWLSPSEHASLEREARQLLTLHHFDPLPKEVEDLVGRIPMRGREKTKEDDEGMLDLR